MKKLKFIFWIIFIIFIVYNSVYFEPLDKVKSRTKGETFDPGQYAMELWNDRLLGNLEGAVDAATLLNLFERDMQQAIDKYANTLGIASTHAYLVKGHGRILVQNDEGVLLTVREPDTVPDIVLQTEYIFGNAIRDACGLINVSEFPSTMDFNNISVEINKIVKKEVVPEILKNIEIGKMMYFIGAAEVNEDNPEIHPLKIIPISVEGKQ